MNKGIYVVIDTPTLWHDARFIIDIVFMAAAVFHLEKFHYHRVAVGSGEHKFPPLIPPYDAVTTTTHS